MKLLDCKLLYFAIDGMFVNLNNDTQRNCNFHNIQPFEGYHNADVTLGENKFDTSGLISDLQLPAGAAVQQLQ